jgi:uncharacterized BrkB/YihY/UPF0761 family membrane protein
MIATTGAFDNAVSTIPHRSAGSTYGAGGSLVAVVVWIYYLAQIFFFGAEFTRVYFARRKCKSEPGGAGRGRQLPVVRAPRIKNYQIGQAAKQQLCESCVTR